MFWIHGGGFAIGTANDANLDGGNLASMETFLLSTGLLGSE
jgi:carboxylesterase type B